MFKYTHSRLESKQKAGLGHLTPSSGFFQRKAYCHHSLGSARPDPTPGAATLDHHWARGSHYPEQSTVSFLPSHHTLGSSGYCSPYRGPVVKQYFTCLGVTDRKLKYSKSHSGKAVLSGNRQAFKVNITKFPQFHILPSYKLFLSHKHQQ